jgi:hypothetical protein
MGPRLNFDFKIATILLLLAVIPILLGTWWLLKGYEDAYLDLAGEHLGDAAETAFSSVNGYLQNQIITVASLAEIPQVRDAVALGNQDLRKNLDEVRKAMTATQASWPGLAPDSPQVRAATQNPAAAYLRRFTEVNQSYREILVTDFLGRVVVATAKPRDYHHALAEWWKETYGDGRRGTVYIGDVYWDGEAKAHLMDIAQPLVEKDGGVIGVIHATIDTQAIHSLLGSFQSGLGVTVGLIHAKGDVISAEGYSSLQQITHPGTLDLLNAREKGRRYFVATASPAVLYGLTQRRFNESYPHLNWMVFTSGKKESLTGALPQMRAQFNMLLLGAILLALIATIMLSRVESKPVLEEDPHLEKL